MPEPIEPTPAGGPTPTPTSEPTPTPVAEPSTVDFTTIIGPDGKFNEGWKNTLPEELRDELSLDTFDSFPESMRQLISAQKMIGRDKVALPTDKSTQAELDAFYNKLGRPATPGEYKYTPPEDISIVDLSPEFVNPVMQNLHKAGLTQKQVDAAMGEFHGFMKNLETQAEAIEEQEFQEAETKIKESGVDIEEDKHAANMLIADNCPDDEFREKLLEVINDNALRPYLFSFLANIERKYFGSHGGLPATDANGNAITTGNLRNQAQELQATPGYMDGSMKNTNPAQFSRLTNEITALFNKADELERQQKQQ